MSASVVTFDDVYLRELRQAYVDDEITVEQFERGVRAVLWGESLPEFSLPIMRTF